MKATERPVIDTLRCTDSMLRAIINELDAQETIEQGDRKSKRGNRQHDRWPFANPSPSVMELHRPGEGVTRYLVAPRNISKSGISLLSGMFVHPGTVCAVNLTTLDGRTERWAGVVRRCRFAALRLHELGIRFNKEMDVARFVTIGAQAVPTLESRREEMLSAAEDLAVAVRRRHPESEVDALLITLMSTWQDMKLRCA